MADHHQNGSKNGNGVPLGVCIDTDEDRRKRREQIERKLRDVKPDEVTGLFDLLEQHVEKATRRSKPVPG